MTLSPPRPSTLEGGFQLAFHLALLLGCGALAFSVDGPMSWMGLVAYSIVFIALFAPNHECVHRTVFRPAWANDALAWVLGLLLAIPSLDFRYFHFAHHRHTQDPLLDPELAEAKPSTVGGYLLALSAFPYWISTAKWFWALAIGRNYAAYLPKNKQAAVTRQARQYLALYALAILVSVVCQTWLLLQLWVLPLLIGQPFLRAYLMAEHTGCDHSRDMFANTRSVLANPLVRALFWNMPLHAEHHADAQVPFWALPQAYDRAKGKHKYLENSYLGVHKTLTAQLTFED